jgi:NADPH-dependent 2,4-dienoyl-CoA reductase/sulfur reductase-like enzyme
MEFQGGWESPYVRQIKEVSTKPVFLVGRITMPDVAEHLLATDTADAICLARQLFTDPEWANKAQEGRADDIRACVASNFCWKSVSRGGRVQCVYNPVVGREGKWGAGTLTPVAEPRHALVIGGGPAGLEYARVAAARGHRITVLEATAHTGGHTRIQAMLPSRSEFGEIGRWLAQQAGKNGADIRTEVEVTEDNLDAILAQYKPDHVVVATGAKGAVDGFQGWTADGLPGWETGNCVTWEDVVINRSKTPPRSFPGHAVVIVVLKHTHPLHKVTIIPRGQALGATMYLPKEDIHNRRFKELNDIIAVTMAGRIAEQMFTDDISSGASGDIQQATSMAKAMVMHWGMSDQLGMVLYGESQEYVFLGRDMMRSKEYSEQTALRIDAEVKRIIDDGFKSANAILTEYRDKVQLVAQALLEYETLEGSQVADIVRTGTFTPHSPRPDKSEPPSGAQAATPLPEVMIKPVPPKLPGFGSAAPAPA